MGGRCEHEAIGRELLLAECCREATNRGWLANRTRAISVLTLTPFAAFIVAFFLSLSLTPIAKRIALRVGAVDLRTRKKIHARDVPRLGGLAIAVAFYVPLLVLALRVNFFAGALYERPGRVAALLLGGLAILALGVYDDVRGASALKKLIVQIPVAAFAWWCGVRIGGTAGPSGAMLSFPPLFSLLITVAWLVVVTNAMNLIDGLDGLASGIALQALAACALCAWHREEAVLAVIAICLAGSVAGFLVHNFHPASIFMGDSGSMLLGWIVGVAAAWSSQKAATTVGVMLPALVLTVPLIDTSLSVLRRIATGKNVFQGDLNHVHHRLVALGWSQRQSVLVLYAIALLFSTLSVVLVFVDDHRIAWPTLALAALMAVGFSSWLWRLRVPLLKGDDVLSDASSPAPPVAVAAGWRRSSIDARGTPAEAAGIAAGGEETNKPPV